MDTKVPKLYKIMTTVAYAVCIKKKTTTTLKRVRT